MKKKLERLYIGLNFLLLLVVAVFGATIFCGGAEAHGPLINGSLSTHIAPAKPQLLDQADLKVSDFFAVELQCFPGQTYRYVNFTYTISNIGNIVSPQYFVMVADQSGRIVGGGSDGILQPSGYGGGGQLANTISPGRHKFTITVYPLNSGYYSSTNTSSYTNFINWSLDANLSNNAEEQLLYVNPCP